jgi:TonB-dependent receptor
VTLTASYTGVKSAALSLDAKPGANNTLDFELHALVIDSRAAAAGAEGEVVTLDRFVVSEERSGQAKAIMEQRAAVNAKTVIATDNFGDLTLGDVGEFLKYMPGVTIDGEDGAASFIRVAGLDPKYVAFSVDGITIASAANPTRATTFTQLPITGIESIEFNQTRTADMEAGAGAGAFNLRSKYAFDLRAPILRFQLGLDGVGDAIELGRVYMPDDKKHYRSYPGGQLNYGGVFLKRRLGIEASVSRYAAYILNQSNEVHYAYPIRDETINPGVSFNSDPVIQRLYWRDAPRIETRYAANLSLDFKITPNLVFAIRNTFTLTDNEFYNLNVNLIAWDESSTSDGYTGPPPNVRKVSTRIKWSVVPTDSVRNTTSLYTSNYVRRIHDTSCLVSPRLTYKKGAFSAELRGGFSRTRREWQNEERGYFVAANDRIGGIGWIATRPDGSSPEWTLTQTAGTPWSQPQNWNRHGVLGNHLTSNPANTENTQGSVYFDLAHARRVFGHPVSFKAGAAYRRGDFSFHENSKRLNYLGPTGMQMEAPVPWTQNYIFSFDLAGKGGNIGRQDWRADSNSGLWAIYQEHPDWFWRDEVGDFLRQLTATRELTEEISAAYLDATTRFGRLQLNAGIRADRTETEVKILRMRSWEEIIAARAHATPDQIASGMFDYGINAETGYPGGMSTIAGILYRYYDGQRFSRNREYDNLFLSGGLKYDITKNFRFQLSASQAILRPDYNNLAAVINSDIYTRTIWVPNPLLKPEKTTKYYAGLHWYLNPAGILSASAFRLDITDKQISPVYITARQAELQTGFNLNDYIMLQDGTAFDPEGSGIEYRSVANAEGIRSINGVTLEYNQQLTFLPGILKGLGVFGSFTTQSFHGAREDRELLGFAAKSANGGVKYRYGRFNILLRATWVGDRLAGITDPIEGRRWVINDYVYRRERFAVDLSGGFRLNRNLELAFSIRNLTNAPDIWYSITIGRLMRYNIYGTIWNLSLKGSY